MHRVGVRITAEAVAVARWLVYAHSGVTAARERRWISR